MADRAEVDHLIAVASERCDGNFEAMIDYLSSLLPISNADRSRSIEVAIRVIERRRAASLC